MANLNKMNKENKNSTVFTPERLSKTIFNIINNTYNFKTIFDPCIGENGGMTKFFFENEYKVIGADIDKRGEEHCHLFFNQDIKQSNIPDSVKPNLIVMNPPFNGNGRGDNLLYPHLFLKEMFDRFGEDIPVVMITGDNFLNNNSMHSKRLKYISDGKFNITSIMTLPLDTFEDVKFNTQVLFFNMPKLQPYYIYDISKPLTATLTKPLTMEPNLQKKEKQIDLKKEYNLLTKVSPFVKNTLNKINIILNINNILNKDYKLLRDIVGEIQHIDIPKNSTARKSFTDALNQVLKDRDRLSENINAVVNYFNKLKNGETIEKVVENKSSLNIHKKKAYVVKFFKDIELKTNDKNLEMVCQTIITRVQNSNDFTPIIYTDIKRGFLTEEEVINFTNLLVKDYKQVSSHVLFSLAGNKNEMKKIIDKTIKENINMNVVEKVVIPFIGSGSEYMNILPKIEGKNIPVVFSAYENTPYQLFIDIRDNREDLTAEIKKVEIEQAEFTKNSSTNHEKYHKFNLSKLEELNKLEREDKRGVRTSALFMFISAKGFGGNLSWVGGETKLSFPKDMNKSIRSVSSKIEYFGHLMDKCDITIENESFEVMIDKYDSITTLFLLDPQYLKLNSYILEPTRTTYGNKDFPHDVCIDMTTKIKGQFLYHNYKNFKLMELMNKEHIGVKHHTKFIKNTNSTSSSFETCVELIYHSKIENFPSSSLNNENYQPQKMVS